MASPQELGSTLIQCGTCYKSAASGQKLLKCARCRRAYYCNAECQRTNWPDHKRVCSVNLALRKQGEEVTKARQAVEKTLGVKLSAGTDVQALSRHLHKWLNIHRPSFGEAIAQSLQLTRKSTNKALTHGIVFHLERRPEAELDAFSDSPELMTGKRFILTSTSLIPIQEIVETLTVDPGFPLHVETLKRRFADPKFDDYVPIALLQCGPMHQTFQMAFPKQLSPRHVPDDRRWESKLKARIASGVCVE